MKTSNTGKLNWMVFVAIVASGSAPAWAVPVLNLNSPGAEEITVFPDNMDKNIYYIAPTVMTVATDDSGLPQLSYAEYGGWFQSKGAILQSTMRAQFSQKSIDAAETRIRQINPQAHFAELPFMHTKIVFGKNVDSRMINASFCDHAAGNVSDEQVCSFDLNKQGRKIILAQLKSGLALTLTLQYDIDGVSQTVEGKFEKAVIPYSIAGRLGGPELLKFPQLFRDKNGDILK